MTRASRLAVALGGTAVWLSACGGSGPRPIPLDPDATGALVLLSKGAEAQLRQKRLEIRGSGPFLLGIRDQTIDLRRTPVLHVVLSHRSARPAVLRGEVSARRMTRGTRGEAPEDGGPLFPSVFPATIRVPFDAGAWSTASPRHLWLDLGSLPGTAVPDALSCEVHDLTLRLDAGATTVLVEKAGLHPRTLRTRGAVLQTSLACGHRLGNNVVWLTLLPLLAAASSLATVARAVWRLPRPLEPVVMRNASLRLLRTFAAHLLAGVLVAWSIDAATQAILTLGGIRSRIHTQGNLTDDDLWGHELASLHPSLPSIGRLASASVPESSSLQVVGQARDEAVYALRYLLFPRSVTRRTPAAHTLYFSYGDLTGIKQDAQGGWVTLSTGDLLAQSYALPPGVNELIGLELRVKPGTLEPGERLVARFYARGIARKYRGIVRTTGRAIFLLPEAIPIESPIGLFDLQHEGGGDGSVELACALHDVDPAGFLEGPEGTRVEDLAYHLAFTPLDHELVAFTPEGASLHRRREGTR